MTRNSVAAVVIAILMVAARPAAGQSIGASLAGVVHDESGARLPGVTLTLTNTANGRTQTVISDARGEFRAVALQPAPYRLVAEHSGFARLEQDVTLNVGSELTIDLQLTIAGVRETVTVAATLSPAVAKSQPSALVSAEDITSLPEIGRNFLVTAQLLPSSGPLNSTVTRFATTRFGGMADQRSGFTTLVDGGDVDDAQWGSPVINLTQEAVQEFKVFRHQFDAQYRQRAGSRRLGRHQGGWESARWQRVLLRARRHDERTQRFCRAESVVRRAAARRDDGRPAGSRQSAPVRRLRARSRRHRSHHLAPSQQPVRGSRERRVPGRVQ